MKFKIIIGWSLLILGVFGLFLPVLQGILMITAGLAILSAHYIWADKLKKWFMKKIKREGDEKNEMD